MANLSMKTNQQMTVTFHYGNVARTKSSKQPGSFYWTFALEGGDKLLTDDDLVVLIRDTWPGRGGTLLLTKNGAKDYVGEVIKRAEKIFPLQVTQWDETENKYVEVEGAWPDSSSEPKDVTPKSQKPVEKSWAAVDGIFRESLRRTCDIWEGEFTGEDGSITYPPGDSAGAIERMAVSMVINAMDMGLKPPDANDKLLAAIDGEIVTGETGGGGGDPGPTEPADKNDDDELPF